VAFCKISIEIPYYQPYLTPNLLELQTTAARRRKPGDQVKYVPPPSKNLEDDISENDNYPEEFKQKIKGGVITKANFPIEFLKILIMYI
jgi:hypothetical protein